MAIAAVVVWLAAGCATSRPAPTSSAAPSEKVSEAPRCDGGTLGIETASISRALRTKLGLPPALRGAAVAEVSPGGPGEKAGIRRDDIVVEVGGARIANDCEFVDAAYGRLCEPVTVVVQRAGASVEKRLVPVDRTRFYDRSCAEGNASGCFRKAWLLYSAAKSEAEKDGALEAYAAACRSGSAEACAYQGHALIGQPGRGAEAVAILEQACKSGSGAGCAHLGFLFATGKLVPRDDRRATPLYIESCDLGDARGCYNVGLMLAGGRGAPRDQARALEAYREACEGGSSTACTNLGFQYERGTGVGKNLSKAFELYRRGCDGTSCQPSNRLGCVNVGRAYRDGLGVGKDPAQAAKVFEGACDRPVDPEDLDDAGEHKARACSLLGALHLNGTGVEKDQRKGRELSELGCSSGDAFGCFNAAVIYASGLGVKPDPARAASFYDLGCKAGDGEACDELGKAYEKGNGVALDRRRATELRRKACELGFEAACVRKGR